MHSVIWLYGTFDWGIWRLYVVNISISSDSLLHILFWFFLRKKPNFKQICHKQNNPKILSVSHLDVNSQHMRISFHQGPSLVSDSELNQKCTHDTNNELFNHYSQNFLPSKISSSSFIISSSSEQMLSTFTSISVTGEEIECGKRCKVTGNRRWYCCRFHCQSTLNYIVCCSFQLKSVNA